MSARNDDEATAQEIVAGVTESIGFQAVLTNAAWGNEFASRLYAIGHEAAIKYVMADGAEGYRAKHLSQTRAAAREASRRLASKGRDVDSVDECIARQLSFAVLATGLPPVPLRHAKHALIAQAYREHTDQLQGHLLNNDLLRRAMQATAPWPDRTVGQLVSEGLIDPADLAEAA